MYWANHLTNFRLRKLFYSSEIDGISRQTLDGQPDERGEASEDNEDSEGEDEDDGRAAPRTVWSWGGSFAVYKSQNKPGNHDLLEILKREADKDLDFATFLIKYLYAVHQVTPPCPQLPRLLTDIKELWGLHTGKRAVEALTAKEEDMVDEVLGRPPVVRCRVCHKPSETGVHPECRKRKILLHRLP